MPRYDFSAQRLFLDTPLMTGSLCELDRNQANYLLNVLRLKDGSGVLVFNGRDGEWQTRVVVEGRKKAHLECIEQARAQTAAGDLVYLFAPLKQARLDYMIQKAVEMGASHIVPVLTQYTQVRKVNAERMRSNAIEAAEQCGVLSIPTFAEPADLATAIDALESDRTIIFCDEGEASQNPLPALQAIERGPLAVLIGPEGGFSEDERTMLRERANVVPIPLGPRVLRADTAAVAALALVQAVLGDWK
ncbi:16S rRNA (uracil(1498)-N(3))-methyltransferase [Pseudahrensia aquimaris]|uniref:Ribosomal RNA small subunit methyltransferase E n=1 Tax=Pseudahrensia aquimaris TaxID=744461 RepID=A0ABW3FEJ5_9HYPH